MSKFKFKVSDNSNVLKFQQLVDAITDAISRKELKHGEMLPSVNQIMKESHLSRDTVFKAYAELKKRGIVESVPNRGYFVSQKITKVFLFLDTFKAYKEVLYHSFLNHLPDNVSVDLHFHHYNIDIFEKIIKESTGKYTKYIIMNFDNERVPEIIKNLPQNQLMIIDWKINTTSEHSTLFQNFGEPVYTCLNENLDKISQYDELVLYYPSFTYHPKDAIEYFERFCKNYELNYRVIFDAEEFVATKNTLYFLVSDRTLANLLDQCAEKGLETGRDVGVISYNETPMKKYVKNGITVISTDFNLMGKKAAEFVVQGEPMNFEVPTSLTLRSSL